MTDHLECIVTTPFKMLEGPILYAEPENRLDNMILFNFPKEQYPDKHPTDSQIFSETLGLYVLSQDSHKINY